MIIQIDGISGTGKTTAAEELARRGYTALDADESFGYYGNPETGEPTDERTQHNWIWDIDKVKTLAVSSGDTTIFVCGGAMNQDRVRDIFDKRFTLVIDNDTMRHRLMTRTNNEFGKHPDDLARQLEWNKGATEYAKSIGAIVIDATKPIEQVVDNILRESGVE
ncbi:nucleoside kinase [Candidatus Saccharibacteria bacterium]|nr:nucleoside kinase [Candidatus Saccharibacteria bacterium]